MELKNTVVGEGAKVPHLSYMGDADIGAGTNVGAGVDHREPLAPPRAGQVAHENRA